MKTPKTAEEIRASEDRIIDRAQRILYRRACAPGAMMDSPQVVKDFLRMQFWNLEHEVFAVMYLNSQHQVIDFDIMFRGTLSQTSVYPREVVKAALVKNAGAVVLAHNHPSGVAEPSRADEHLTNTLKSALQLVDVRVLDHFVVGQHHVVSFAERGLL